MDERLHLSISLDRGHLTALLDALELLSRIGMGQFEEVLEHAPIPNRNRDAVRDYLGGAKIEATGLPRNSSFGIADREHVPAECRAAYDLFQVIRQKYARWTAAPPYSVWRNDPLLVTDLRMPEAEIKESVTP